MTTLAELDVKITGQMLPEDLQRSNEYRFSRKHIDRYIHEAIEASPVYQGMVEDGVKRVNAFLAQEYFESKNARLAQLKKLNIEELVRDLLTASAYFQRPETYVSATSIMARHLDFDDHRDSIQTVAELGAVLCWTQAFTLWKETLESSLMIQSNFRFPEELTEAINRSMYLPPMVSEPRDVRSNFESPYLTHNDCRILGKKNGHTGDICLDVINRQNKIALKLDTAFLSTVEEEPNHALDTLEKIQEWNHFKHDSYCLYNLMVKQGNQFWLDNKVDKRGRLYAQGYHITTQGSAFKKAMLEFVDEEIVDGVPNHQSG